jgi:membrane-associated protease RseP (regulator of RpoE activity)
MAQELARVQKLGGNPLVVGIMGSGHLANRFGVPHQLEGLGLKSTVLLPWTLGWDCNKLTPTYADAVFGLEEAETEPQQQKPLLGVRIDASKDGNGVLVEQVIEESVAEDAGLEDGDIITKAAGIQVKDTGALVSIIQRQAPGTWLPLEVSRDGDIKEIIAKFPKAPY